MLKSILDVYRDCLVVYIFKLFSGPLQAVIKRYRSFQTILAYHDKVFLRLMRNG
jgi:hypothetical protein